MTAAAGVPVRRGRPVDLDKDKAILEAARSLLLARGPRAMTMDAVAAAAGVSKATLYSRHPRRSDLLLAVVAVDAAFVSRALHGQAQTLPALHAQLCEFVTDLTAFLCGSHHRRMTQALSEEPQRRADLQQIFRGGPQRTLDALAHCLQGADARGLLHCSAPAESAELLLGMAMGMDLVRAQYGEPLSRRQPAARRRHVAQVVDSFVQLHQPRR
jgi:TetR/AcrR family transcriptional repressor of mexJK operon